MSVDQLYEQSIMQLPAAERLRLAARILNDLARDESGIDDSDEWTDEDLEDFTRSGWQLLEQQVGGEEDA